MKLKKQIIITLVLLSVQCVMSAQTGAGIPVHDKSLEYQIKWTYGGYHEVTRDSLNPFLWYWAFHNPYYYGSQPNYEEVKTAKTYTQWTEYLSKQHEEANDSIYKRRLVKDLYNTIDVAYLLEQQKFERMIDTFYFYNDKIRRLDLENSDDIADDLKESFLEVYDKVKAIKTSYLENHKREDAYLQYEEEMDKIIIGTKKIYKLLNLCANSVFN